MKDHPGQTTQIVGNAIQASSLVDGPEAVPAGRAVTEIGSAIRATDHEDVGTAVPVTTNTNPYKGPVDQSVIVVDKSGNAIPVKPGESITGNLKGDGQMQQVHGPDGTPTGLRKDGLGHPTQSDPAAQQPHAHVPGVTQPNGNPHLPINY
jgi:hypothetical protein